MAIRTNQKRAIMALLANKTNKEAAAAAGVGERTLARWLAEDQDFIDALQAAEDQLIREATFRLVGLVEMAVRTLGYLAEKSRKETVRKSAADSILNYTQRLTELRSLADRVAALEKKIK